MKAMGVKDSSVERPTFHQNLLSQAFAELRNQYAINHKLDDFNNFYNVQYDEFWDDLVAKLAELMHRTNKY